MKELIIISAVILICFLFMALSCEQQKPAPYGAAPGLIWNYANATVAPYTPNYRNSGTYNPAPLSRPYNPIPLER